MPSAAAAQTGPYDIHLLSTPSAPQSAGEARLQFASSPFGIAVAADGRAIYDVRITASGLPSPSTVGAYSAFVAWAVTTDLKEWVRLGSVTNGTNVVGSLQMNKFLLVITAEASASVAMHAGPTMLHGTSPSGWLQSFLTHPLFRGISQ